MLIRAVILLFAMCSVAQAGITMGSSAVPSASSVQVVQQNIAPPFVGQTTVDITQKNCVPYSGKGPTPPNPCPVSVTETVTVTHIEPICVDVHSGSLKQNVTRIVKEAGWETAVWKMPYDYKWVGDVQITANDIQGVLTKLLEGYPVQAVFYNANHVVAFTPRRNT